MAPFDQIAFNEIVLDTLSMLDIVHRPRGASGAHPCHSIIYPVIMDPYLVDCPTETCKSCAFLWESEQCKAEVGKMDDLIVRRSNVAAHVLSDIWLQSPKGRSKKKKKGKENPSNAGLVPPLLPSETAAPAASEAASASTAAVPNPPTASISVDPPAAPDASTPVLTASTPAPSASTAAPATSTTPAPVTSTSGPTDSALTDSAPTKSAPADSAALSAAPSVAPSQPAGPTSPPDAASKPESSVGPVRLYPFEAKDFFHLVASDGGGFYVTRGFLLRHFAFFADFESFPSETEENGAAKDEEKVETRELPAASSAGLHLLLSTLEASHSSLPAPATRGVLPLGFTTTWTHSLILTRLPDALRIADAYDVPAFAPVIATTLPSSPWYRFLVAALVSDEAAAKKASTETLPLHISSIPPEVTSLLMVHANSYLVRLRELHMAKKKSYAGLRAGWAHAFPFHDKNEGFGKHCGGRNHLAHIGKCLSNSQYDGNFSDFRKASAKVAFEALKESEKDGTSKSDDEQWRAIAKALSSDIRCYVCAVRMKKTFQVVWRNWATEWRPKSI
ncbi:hypothetical protein IAT38_001548 [Cryptococcus sp. DSM 104549]